MSRGAEFLSFGGVVFRRNGVMPRSQRNATTFTRAATTPR